METEGNVDSSSEELMTTCVWEVVTFLTLGLGDSSKSSSLLRSGVILNGVNAKKIVCFRLYMDVLYYTRCIQYITDNTPISPALLSMLTQFTEGHLFPALDAFFFHLGKTKNA